MVDEQLKRDVVHCSYPAAAAAAIISHPAMPSAN